MPITRASWYSQLPPFGWFDRGDRPGSNALGVPDWQQGIATPGRQDLGKWFNVTPPGESVPYPMQKTDIGPAKWTGRGVDISAAGAHQMGYTPKNFPTDAAFKIEPRDEPRGLGSPAGLPVQAGDLPDNANPDAVASGPQQSAARKSMPNSLMDMFQPTDPMGKPAGWNDAIAQRSNSLIGLGLGLLQPTQPGSGQTGFSQGLRGLMAGSVADTRNAEHRQQLARQASQDQFQRDQAKQAQSNWEQQFARGDPAKAPTEFTRAARDLGLTPGTPEHAQFARQYYSTKSEGNLAAQAEQRQAIAKSLGMDPADPKTRAWIAGGGTLTDENKPPAGYVWGPDDPQTGRKTQVPIEGGPATKLSDTAAGHLALLQAAKPGLEEAKKYFLDPKPLLMREGGDQPGGSLYSAGKQYLGEKTGSFEIGRQRRNVRLGVEAALRAATGAAAPETEVERYTDMYSPSITDSYETRKQKIDALDRFITTYEGIATRGHGAPKQQAPAASSGGVRRYNPETGKIE